MDLAKPTYDRSFALIIGINKYQSASPLHCAVNDAEAIASVLRTRFGFEQENITLLLNQDATRSAIYEAYLSFVEDNTSIDDRLFVFFAGHGHTARSRRGEVGYLVPVDGDTLKLASLLRWDALTRDTDLITAKHVFFIMDACYGGLATMRSLAPGASRFLKDMMQRFSRQVLTAGKADEQVVDRGGPRADHSLFTGHLLDGLESAAHSSDLITANGVMGYVYRKVSDDAESAQTPHFGYLSGDGDFIFNPPSLDSISTDETKDEDVLIAIPTVMTSSEPPQSFADRAKLLLSRDEDRIRLHDFVAQETRSAISTIGPEALNASGSWSSEEFAGRVEKYEKATENLQTIQMLLGYWGTDAHRDVMVLPATRLADLVTSQSGLVAWLNLRWYPVLMLLYTCGLGAVASRRYENLRHLLNAPIRDRRERRETEPLVQALFNGFSEMKSAFQTLPGHERQYVPVSEYLLKKLQPLADDILFTGGDYEMHFDRVEMLIALECAYHDGGWGPIGRFGWKHHSRGGTGSPFNALVAEAEPKEDEWEPIKAGMFGGDYSSFKKAADEYKKMLDGLHWW